MSDKSPLNHAIRLFIDSGEHVRSWTTRFVATNGALLSLLGALVAWGDPTEDGLELYNDVLMAICLLGALGSLLLGSAVFRQLRWSRQCADRIRALQDSLNPVLPGEGNLAGGRFAAALTMMTTALISMAWIALLVAIPHLGSIVETSVKA